MIISKKKKSLSLVELEEKIRQLHETYMPMNLSPIFYEKKISAIKKLEYILKNASRRNVQNSDFEEILLCALTLVYYFGMMLKLNMFISRFSYWCGKRQFHKAEIVFQKTMDRLQPERSEATIKITLEFISLVSLWPFENFVEQILEVVLYYNKGNTMFFNLMLTNIHYVISSDIKSARHRIRILYELLKSDHWVIDRQKLLPFVTRLLDFYAYSIDKSQIKTSTYGNLKKGFQVCLRRIFERVENKHRILIITTMLNWFSMVNMNDDDVLEFSSLLDHVAELYEVRVYADSFREGIFEHVLNYLVGSSNALYSLIGCRLLQRFLDRQRNAQYLLVPTIYYEFSQVRLKIGYYDSTDKVFIRFHREKLHEYILKSVRCHCYNAGNIKAIYAVVCSMVLEVPCSLTAAAAACIVMAIQDYALHGEKLPATCRYWMHTIVISVMSLICWVHKAPVLYRYVNQIISRRAKEAPQLNPPLMQHYIIGRHHVTWNKPSLFVEDWELRYGLWKHFKDAQPPVKIHETVKLPTAKAPTMDIRK